MKLELDDVPGTEWRSVALYSLHTADDWTPWMCANLEREVGPTRHRRLVQSYVRVDHLDPSVRRLWHLARIEYAADVLQRPAATERTERQLKLARRRLQAFGRRHGFETSDDELQYHEREQVALV